MEHGNLSGHVMRRCGMLGASGNVKPSLELMLLGSTHV
jgi:hypothetical protein